MSFIKNNTYKVFGMIIESEITCTELEQTTGEPEVFIHFDKIPAGSKHSGSSKDHFFLSVKNIADYLILNGNEIIIEKSQDVNEDTVRLHLLGSAFGALIHQRGLLPIHGSAVTSGDFAFLLSGESGTGKSTLANAFIKNDYLLLTDDVCVVSLNNEKPLAHPAYPQMKLWKKSIDFLNINLENLRKIHQEVEKYAISVPAHYFNKPVPLKYIFILEKNKNATIEILKLKGVEKFDALMKNIYRLHFIRPMNINDHNFKMVSTVARQLDVYSVKRPDDLTLMDGIMKHISSIIKS